MMSRMLLLAATAALSFGAAASVVQAATPTPPSTLYLQQASGGTLKGDTLTLRGVAPRTTTFLDRPQRSGGSETTSSFASGFGQAFGSDAPNAALEVTDAPASRDVALLELRAPHYDAAKHTLTYTVRRLSTTKSDGLAGLAKRNDGAKVTHFGRATLFIDDGGATSTVLVAQVQLPGGTSGSINVSDATLGAAFDVAGIETYGAGAGVLNLTSSSISFTSYGGGLDFQLAIFVTPGAATFDGTASLPAGATLSLNFPGQPGTSIANGAFSLPVPST